MKKEGIQTRNRKISTKLKKSSMSRDPRFDAANFKFCDNYGTFGAAAAIGAAYSGSFGQTHMFGGVHPHHPHAHPGHMTHPLTGPAGFGGSHHHPMLPTAHHTMHPTQHPAAASALGLSHTNMVHAMG